MLFKTTSFFAALALVAGCGGSSASGGGGARGTTVASMDANRVQVSIHNGSSQVVCYLRISPVSDPNWGPDQLGGTAISSGGSFTLNGVSCDASSIRLIAEDRDGCFLYKTVSCADQATWDITNSDIPDCGN